MNAKEKTSKECGDQFDLIDLRLAEIQTIADLLSPPDGDVNSTESRACFLIRRLADEASEALRQGLDELNAEVATLKAKGGAA